jgi:hypothetical protein
MRNSSLFVCALIGTALAALLALSAVADRRSALSYFGAVDPSRFEDPVSEEGPVSDDCAWVDKKFETFAGVSVSARVTKQPLWKIEFGEIRAVNIHEAIPSPGVSGSKPYVFVHLEINEEARSRIDALGKVRCGSFVMLRQGGRDLDLAPVVGLGPGVLPGGSFGSREEAERFYGSIGERVSYSELSGENRAYWQSRNDELVETAVWYAKCDPDYLKSLGDGLYEHIMTTPSLRQRSERANCEVGPPQVPLSPNSPE